MFFKAKAWCLRTLESRSLQHCQRKNPLWRVDLFVINGRLTNDTHKCQLEKFGALGGNVAFDFNYPPFFARKS